MRTEKTSVGLEAIIYEKQNTVKINYFFKKSLGAYRLILPSKF